MTKVLGKMRCRRIIVPTTKISTRLDVYLHSELPELSRTAIQKLINSGHVTVNGRVVKPTHTPRAGEVIEISIPEPEPATAKPEPIPLEVLYEDEWIVIINKPPGLVVHPCAGHTSHTLVNALLHMCAGQLSGIGGVERPGIVHRLDKDTSGCLIVAKTDQAHIALTEMFANRRLTKIYHAIVCGSVDRDFGMVSAPIGRHPVHRKCMAVREDIGREAHTSFRILERLNSTTLLELQPHTGRTHQIRVHMKHIGHPVFGDKVYGAKQTNQVIRETGVIPPRFMLHAYQITFTHPITGQTIDVVADRPADFEEVISKLRNTS